MLYSIVKTNTYQDSLRLIRLSNALAAQEGSDRVSVMMGTPVNKDMLHKAGMVTDDLAKATPTDLMVVADVADQETAQALAQTVDDFLSQEAVRSSRGGAFRRVRSLKHALTVVPDANLGLISIPGDYAAAEARRLLERGMNVFLFSDNVPIQDEVELKKEAARRGLIVMGPDCGTAHIHGVPLGFSNAVSAGNIGVVGASGTGTQEVMVQIERHFGGVSHVIGLGGRDLSEEVGGLSCTAGLKALDADPATDVIVLVSKPPAPAVRERVLSLAAGLSKPVVVILVGDTPAARQDGNLYFAQTLEDAARLAVELAGSRGTRPAVLSPGQQGIVGLYAGGTFASEAASLIAAELGLTVEPNHEEGHVLDSGGHRVVDLGDDFYTRGRPHPMIEPSIRNDEIARAFADPATAVVLLDVVLGYGAHPSPAQVLADAVADGRGRAQAEGRDVAVVATLCGTQDDPQALADQRAILQEAGIVVMPSNAAAVRHALHAVRRETRRAPEHTAGDDPIASTLLATAPRVINIGLREFTDALVAAGAHAAQYDWSPAAGGDQKLQRLLSALH